MATKKLFVFFVLLFVLEQSFGNEFDRCPVKSRGAGVLKTHAQRCYQFINYEMFWQDARNYCLHRGGDLITIHRPDIQQFVVRNLKELGWRRNGVWIGATDKHDEEDWRWVTGEKVTSGYQNWDSGQPSCWLPEFMCTEDCAVLRLDEGYKWHDYFCAATRFEYAFICQYDMIPVPNVSLKAHLVSPKRPVTEKAQPSTTDQRTTAATTTTDKPYWYGIDKHGDKEVDGEYAKTEDDVLCYYMNKTYNTGDQFLDIDDCNMCNCFHGHVACTEMACMPVGADCVYHGEEHKSGDRFRVDDDCNWCYCKDGHTVCSETYCGPLGNVSVVQNQVGVRSQQVASQDDGMKTGGIVGIVVSFVLVFVAGLIIGLFLCKRRYKKRYEETASAGFSNVLYTAAPQQTHVKQTNLYMSEQDSDLDEEPPQYTEIDNICVPPPYAEATASCSNIYADVEDIKKERLEAGGEQVGSEQEELKVELPPPPPCGMSASPEIQPSVLHVEQDVSEAFSNNLYGVE